MINETTLVENECKKNPDQSVTEATPVSQSGVDNKTGSDHNGEVSLTEKSDVVKPNEVEVESSQINNCDNSNDQDDQVSEQSDKNVEVAEQRDAVAEESAESDNVVDLSSDNEEDDAANIINIDEEVISSSSNITATDSVVDKENEVNNTKNQKDDSELLDDNLKPMGEGKTSNISANDKDDEVEQEQLKEQVMPAIQLGSTETSDNPKDKPNNNDVDSLTEGKPTEETTGLSTTEEGTVSTVENEQLSNSENSVIRNMSTDQPELDAEEAGSGKEQSDSTAKPSLPELLEEMAMDVDNDDELPVGVEVVMEVDEVDQDDEVLEESTNTTNTTNTSADAGVSKTQGSRDKSVILPLEVRPHGSSSTTAVNDVQDVETITGDSSLSEEAVLKNPDVTVCILSNTSPEKRLSTNDKQKEDSNKTSTSSSDKSSLPAAGSAIEKADNTANRPSVIAEFEAKPSTSKASDSDQVKKLKTLKVLYPKKKFPQGELVLESVAPSLKDCLQCAKHTTCTTKVAISGMDCYLCSKECIAEHNLLHKKAIAASNVVIAGTTGGSNCVDPSTGSLTSINNISVVSAKHQPLGVSTSPPLIRPCSGCKNVIRPKSTDKVDPDYGILQWALMEFCTEECLAKFQAITSSKCQLCGNDVSAMSMGKYSVRFGHETRQFCTSTCLEEFKKGLKACSYCQRDLNSEGSDESIGFLAPVGEKGQFKDFCSQDCLEKYDFMSHNIAPQITAHECSVCKKIKIVRVEVLCGDKIVQLCSEVCYAAFKFVNDKMQIGLCAMCKKYFDIETCNEQIMHYEDQAWRFCSKTCLNVHVLSKRKICPCNWCKVKKYNFDMIRKKMNNVVVHMCSLNCLALYEVSLRASIGKKKLKCDWCQKTEKANFHLTMSDASLRNFCTFECVDKYRAQYKAGLSVNIPSVGSTPSIVVGVPSGSPVNNINTSSTTVVTPKTSISVINKSSSSASKGTQSGASISVSAAGVGTAVPSTFSTGLNSALEVPVISAVHSLKKYETSRTQIKIMPKPTAALSSDLSAAQQTITPQQPQQAPPQVSPAAAVSSAAIQASAVEVLVRPRSPVMMKNKITLVKVRKATKGTSCRPNKVHRYMQTEDPEDTIEGDTQRALIPVPVPIFIPAPMAMFNIPVPTLVPVPIPVPVPILVPTSMSLANDILEDIKRIREMFPPNPVEAEMLTMAEAAAEKPSSASPNVQSNGIEIEEEQEDDRNHEEQQEREQEEEDEDEARNDRRRTVRFMPFESITEIEDTSSCGVDSKTSEQHSPATSDDARDPLGSPTTSERSMDVDTEQSHHNQNSGEGDDSKTSNDNSRDGIVRKRLADTSPNQLCNKLAKRKKSSEGEEREEARSESDVSISNKSAVSNESTVSKTNPGRHMILKYTLGVNSWKYFANQYNADVNKKRAEGEFLTGANGLPQQLGTDLLEMRHEELNQALTLLMKEGKLPNGESYSPDTKYYLALGIQYYLLHNGRIDNLFSDPSYETFTDQLDNEAKLFQGAIRGNNIVTRVQEEHLWESRQLGVHSPHVLLSTLMYLNTKYFNLTSVEEHMELSFTQIIKQNKIGSSLSPINDEENREDEGEMDDNANSSGRSSTRSVLRFYPPQKVLESNPKKKKMYEQTENEEDPSRCPVRLYEFYLSRCPESVKSANDVFYLQPERSCAPDSPVWYTSAALPDSSLKKMLNRIKMVKEINIAMLSQ